MEDSSLKSHHIFIFPFKWEQKGENLKDRYSLDELGGKIENTKWESNDFNLQGRDCYNEYNYFYRHVREILYEQEDILIEEKKHKKLIKHYEYPIEDGLHYCIKTSNKTYKLEVDSIILNIYSTGTGVISFHLRNFNYSDKDDILNINQYGRRLYPPHFNLKNTSIESRKKDNTSEDDVLDRTKVELAEAIWLGQENSKKYETSDFCDNYKSYLTPEKYEKGPFLIPKFIEKLFEGIKLSPNKRDIKDDDSCIYMDTVMDDRMFVVCWYGNNGLINNLNYLASSFLTRNTTYTYMNNDWWYKYVFVDGANVTMQNKLIKEEFLMNATYARWIDYGTLYGISRYSFVGLTSDYKNMDNATFIIKHIQSIYYKIAELSLLQRASILSYSEELSHVVENLNGSGDISNAKELYKQFMEFKNKICFDEVTAQEQGIELYDMLQKEMRIPKELKSLEKRMTEMYNYANLLEQEKETEETKKQAKQAKNLTIVATTVAVPSFFVCVLGMSTMPEDIPPTLLNDTPYWPFWYGLIAVVIVSLIVIVIINKMLGLEIWKNE